MGDAYRAESMAPPIPEAGLRGIRPPGPSVEAEGGADFGEEGDDGGFGVAGA